MLLAEFTRNVNKKVIQNKVNYATRVNNLYGQTYANMNSKQKQILTVMNQHLAPKYQRSRNELDNNTNFSMKNRPTSQYLGSKKCAPFKNLREKIIDCQ